MEDRRFEAQKKTPVNCPHCGSVCMGVGREGPHNALRCLYCGRWIRFMSHDDLVLYMRTPVTGRDAIEYPVWVDWRNALAHNPVHAPLIKKINGFSIQRTGPRSVIVYCREDARESWGDGYWEVVDAMTGHFADMRLEDFRFQWPIAVIIIPKPQSPSEEYADYLKSDHWQHVRLSALRWADHRCQLCYRNDRPLHVHHRTYENRGREKRSDLIVLCELCHQTFHDRIGMPV